MFWVLGLGVWGLGFRVYDASLLEFRAVGFQRLEEVRAFSG